ncbi:hypothetical protein KIW84_012905 [Lathyrus oleraceus]|uniref:Uncharacterized protein n=1 Tax=Pisum sativum TaxID=3888 RepID=A0A9D5GWZ3_PEA|nr:hypothetical protein KIW84_012905 [Pisum sativum]
MIDFENLKRNGFDLLSAIKIQGWEKYFNRLQGPVFFIWLENFRLMPRPQFSRCVHHKKPTNSAYYINGDHKYVLYYIITEKKVNLPALIFQYLRNMVKETKDGSKEKRYWIPISRLISDIQMESKMIDSLSEAQITKEMEPQVEGMLNSRSLKNMGLISELTSDPTKIPK